MQNRCRSLLSPSPSPSPIRTVIGNCGNSVAPNMHINFIASNNKSIDNNCETHLIVVLKGGNNAADSRRKLRYLAVADWAMLYNCWNRVYKHDINLHTEFQHRRRHYSWVRLVSIIDFQILLYLLYLLALYLGNLTYRHVALLYTKLKLYSFKDSKDKAVKHGKSVF